MRVKPFRVICALLGVSLALLLTLAGVQAQEATPQATAAVQFDLPQRYADSLYTVNYPDGWMLQTAPGAVSLMSDPQVLTLTEQFGVPPLAHGQIAVQIMSGVLGHILPNAPAQITNVNCTSCHLLDQPASAPVNGVDTAPSPSDVANRVALLYRGDPLRFPFRRAQALKLNSIDAAEATFTSKNDDGLLIEFYLNGQLMNLLALLPAGDLAADQPLVEAIAATIQGVEATPEAASTDSP